ncbi:unnamed protein product [Caenorhabditis angaria]|uniref:Copper transport protein n=1 Tax=Caenorhabditis angaria TaxID=860376 RepID=A0A9P1I5R8_9PELO|nr:unnamed protein product [Caenorhabditis angaria]
MSVAKTIILVVISLYLLCNVSAKNPDYETSVENFLDELDGKEVKPIRKQKEHEHSHHNHNMEGHIMKMWFHGGYEEVILFEFWRTDSIFGIVLSCAAIFIMGATYEGVKWFRVFLSQNYAICTHFNHNKSCVEIALQTRTSNQSSSSRNQTVNSKILQNEPFVVSNNTVNRSRFSQSFSPFSTQRLIQGLLYVIQLILAYWLMLIVMTYNTYLTIAVVLGAGFGHWLFAVLQLRNSDGETTDSFQTDACH